MKKRRILAGALNGAVATTAMTSWMAAGKAAVKYREEQPPKQITRRLAQRIGIPGSGSDTENWVVSAAAHLGFGAGCGALYAMLVPRSTPLRGMAFGLAVWGVSYQGWLPALSLMPPPSRDQPGRALTTLTAHLIYGATLGRGLARGLESMPAGIASS